MKGTSNEEQGAAAQAMQPPVTLVVEYDAAGDLLDDYAANLSAGNIFVPTLHEFEVGTVVGLVLSFPGLLQPIHLTGIARWTRGGDLDSRGVGIELTDFDDKARAALEQTLERVKSRDPGVVSQLVKVLVAEDNPHVARLIGDGLRESRRRRFSEMAFSIRTVSNGREAVDLLRQERFDALIIDLYMPVMDGVTAIAEVRADVGLRKLPIIAVSAGGKGARKTALEAGADLFLAKPMRLRHIIAAMQQLLGA